MTLDKMTEDDIIIGKMTEGKMTQMKRQLAKTNSKKLLFSW